MHKIPSATRMFQGHAENESGSPDILLLFMFGDECWLCMLVKEHWRGDVGILAARFAAPAHRVEADGTAANTRD